MLRRQPNSFRGLLSLRGSRLIDSATRKGLRTSLREGIPANIVANLLGGPLQTAYLLYLGFSSEQIGLIAAIPSLTLVAQLFIAVAMQKWTNRRLAVCLLGVTHRTLWVSTGLIPLLFPESDRFWAYASLYLISFVCAQSSGVIWTSLMADIVPPAVRGRYFGIRNTVHWAVASLTLLAGGQWMEHAGGSGHGFAYLFLVSAVSVVWNGWELARYRNPPFERSDGGSIAKLLAKPLRDRSFRSATMFITVFLLLQNVVVPLFSYAMLNVLRLSYSTVTLITMFQNIVMMFSYIYWGNLNARAPARKLLLWTFPIVSAACAAWLGMGIAPVLLVLLASHLLLGIGLGGYNLLVFNFLIGDTPKGDRPVYVALFSALTGLSGFVGPIVGGWAFKEAEGYPDWVARYGIVAGCGLLLLALALFVAPATFKSKETNKNQTITSQFP
ncbi:MFS transporter [Cohnella zeiphila]|uniref:MFS transporter n=1 Tax=Cohnella zeiphila TaxID=2761120 RepID=A0A7X0VWL9_9BACL|nr:MFS transporter [Cohnella zeiphila]MBB6731078.1 MFS transporter [Cohnella zeiphila]